MNTTYIVTTQGLENYGAHAESGKFSDNNHYWKFKSGTEYMVTGLDREQDAMAFVMAIGLFYFVFPNKSRLGIITFTSWAMSSFL